MGGDRKSTQAGCVIFIPFLMALAPIITHSLGNKKENELPPTGVKLQLAPQAHYIIQNQQFGAAILKIFNAWAALT
jgi:hypothetical protein